MNAGPILLAVVVVSTGLLGIGAVLLVRFLDGRSWARSLLAFKVQFSSQVDVDQISAWLGSVAASSHAPRFSLLTGPPIMVELISDASGITHIVCVPKVMRDAMIAGLRAHIPGCRIEAVPDYFDHRIRPRFAVEARLTSHTRPLAIDRAPQAITALLHSLQPVMPGEQICISWIMTSAGTPKPVPSVSMQRSRTSEGFWPDGDLQADSESVRAQRLKEGTAPLLHAVVRVGIVASSKARTFSLYGRVWGCLRSLNAPGVRVVRRMLPSFLVVDRFMAKAVPITSWPLLLNAKEAAGLIGFPIKSVVVSGLQTNSARQLPPPLGNAESGSIIARSNFGDNTSWLKLARDDRLRHVYAVGPTGVGKSTWLANMAVQDARFGDGFAVIDPKGDLITDILSRIPEERQRDVILLDPSDLERPIGYNVLQAQGSEHARELSADFVLSVLRSLWAAYWGPRTDDVLRASLLTLTHTRALDGSAFTLAEIPELLTNRPFRRFVTEQPTVPHTLLGFWAWFEKLSDAERAQTIGPVMNKLRSFTTRASLRLTLGQSAGLDLSAILRQRKILLVTLARGVIGNDAAYLLGSLIVSGIWQAVLARAALPQGERSPFWLYLDEAHQITRLPVALSDVMAEARGLGLGLHLATQYVAQLPQEIRAAVLSTVRTLVSFQIEPDDARLLEPRFAPNLTARDLSSLGAYEVALRLCSGNQLLAPTTGTTLPLSEVVADADELRATIRDRLGRPRLDVEAALSDRLQTTGQGEVQIGRRKRGGPA